MHVVAYRNLEALYWNTMVGIMRCRPTIDLDLGTIEWTRCFTIFWMAPSLAGLTTRYISCSQHQATGLGKASGAIRGWGCGREQQACRFPLLHNAGIALMSSRSYHRQAALPNRRLPA